MNKRDLIALAISLICGILLQWLYIKYCSNDKTDKLINGGIVFLLAVFIFIVFS